MGFQDSAKPGVSSYKGIVLAFYDLALYVLGPRPRTAQRRSMDILLGTSSHLEMNVLPAHHSPYS